ncbi:MAG: outer membrane beta-barrel protein, partial [Chitinophagaceae bacterium]|nr:outer membrane beta-barrel protein [Chitinophagaceae bacterium]
RMDDSTNKILQAADKNGAFEFDKLPFGMYKLKATASGYANVAIDSINVRAERYDFNLGDIKMKAASAELDEVVVYSEKPLIENKDGKITYNVGESALSNGSSTAELLKNMPLINSDPNGKILLKGKEPKILIDDKPTDLTADQLKDLLESLPGSSIEKIEIMTNPPPQYASESGGVINIVTKKGKIGLTGKTTLTGGTRGEGNLATNINYRHNKFSYNTTFGIGASLLRGSNYSKRQTIYTDSTNNFNTEGSFKNTNLRPNLRLQFDYELNKQNSINLTYQGNLNVFNNTSTTKYSNINRFGETYKTSNRDNASDGTGYSHSITLAYALKAKNPAEVFRFFANGNIGKNDNDRDFYQQFLNSSFVTTSDSTQNQFYNSYNNSYSFRISYDKPLPWKGSNFSTGASFQRGTYHNALNTSFLRKVDSTFVPNDLLSNDFRFHQNISTIRAAFTFSFPQEWRLTFGAQAERTLMDFDFIKGNSSNVKNDYLNLLPTVNLRKEFSKQFNTSLIYRATIRRPGLGELNPNIDYGDPYNLRFGNPFLLPSLSDNFDWNVSWIKGKYYINTSLGYNRVKNIINSIRTLADAGKTQTTWKNIDNRNEYEASVWGGYSFNKQLRMNASAGYSFNEYGEKSKALYKYRNGGTFYTSINYSFMPTTLITFEGNARYSSYADPQGRSKSNLTMTLGVQKKFFNKRLIVGLNAIDPFRVQQYTTYTYGTNFNIESFSSTQTRNFRLSVAYQLNKIVLKSKLTDKQKKDALEKMKKKNAPLPPPAKQ